MPEIPPQPRDTGLTGLGLSHQMFVVSERLWLEKIWTQPFHSFPEQGDEGEQPNQQQRMCDEQIHDESDEGEQESENTEEEKCLEMVPDPLSPFPEAFGERLWIRLLLEFVQHRGLWDDPPPVDSVRRCDVQVACCVGVGMDDVSQPCPTKREEASLEMVLGRKGQRLRRKEDISCRYGFSVLGCSRNSMTGRT